MESVFILGSLPFWGLLAAEFVLVLVLTNYEKCFLAFGSLFAFAAVLQFFGDVNVLNLLLDNWLYIPPFLAAYLLIGAGWSTFKWIRFVRSRIEVVQSLFRNFLAKKGLPLDSKVLPEELKQEWSAFFSKSVSYEDMQQDIHRAPQVHDFKMQIMRWMTLWVFSVLLFFFKDLLVDAFQFMYFLIWRRLQSIANDLYENAGFGKNFPGN